MTKSIIVGSLLSLALIATQGIAAPSIGCTLSASPSVIKAGVPTPVTVTWTTTGADYNGIVAPFLGGSRPPSGSRVFVVSTPQRYELIALSNTPLINSVGTDAVCVATVSASSHTAP